MSRKPLVVGAAVVLVVLAGLGAAFVFGGGPAPGGTGDTTLTDFPTETSSSAAGDGSTAGTATASPSAPFAFDIERIEACGQTCRDVTASLTNQQDEPAADVTVVTRIYAGRDNTADDDLVWSGEEEVGVLGAGETHTTTKRVELSLSEGLQVENSGGWVTVVTTVRTADRTVTYTESRQVA